MGACTSSPAAGVDLPDNLASSSKSAKDSTKSVDETESTTTSQKDVAAFKKGEATTSHNPLDDKHKHAPASKVPEPKAEKEKAAVAAVEPKKHDSPRPASHVPATTKPAGHPHPRPASHTPASTKPGAKPKLTIGLNNARPIIYAPPTPEEIAAKEKAEEDQKAAAAEAAARSHVEGQSGTSLLGQTTETAVASKAGSIKASQTAAEKIAADKAAADEKAAAKAVAVAKAVALAAKPVEPPKLFGGKPKLAPPSKKQSAFRDSDRSFLDNMMNSTLTRNSKTLDDVVQKKNGEVAHLESELEIFPTPGFIIKTRRMASNHSANEVKVFINVCHSPNVSKMFIPPSGVTLDKAGTESVVYMAVLTETKYKQMEETKDDELRARISKALVSHINKSRKDTLSEDAVVLLKKAKKYIGDQELQCYVPQDYNAANASDRESMNRDSMQSTSGQSISLPASEAPKMTMLTEESDEDEENEGDSIFTDVESTKAGAAETKANTAAPAAPAARIYVDRATEGKYPLWVRRKNDQNRDYWKNNATNQKINYDPYVKVEAEDPPAAEDEGGKSGKSGKSGKEEESVKSETGVELSGDVDAAAESTEAFPVEAQLDAHGENNAESGKIDPLLEEESETAAEEAPEIQEDLEFVFRPDNYMDELELAGSGDFQPLHFYCLSAGWIHQFAMGEPSIVKTEPPGCEKFESSVWMEGYRVVLTGDRAAAATFMITREKNGDKLRFSLIHEDKRKPQMHFIAMDTNSTEAWMKKCKEHIYFADWVSIKHDAESTQEDNRFDMRPERPDHRGMRLTMESCRFACFARDMDLILKIGPIEKPKSWHVDSRILILVVNSQGTHRLMYMEEKSMSVKGGFIYGTSLGCAAEAGAAGSNEFDVTGMEKDGKSLTTSKTVKFRSTNAKDAAEWVTLINAAKDFVPEN